MRCQIGTGESLKQKIVIVHLRWVLVLWSSDVTQYDENMTNKQSQCGGGGGAPHQSIMMAPRSWSDL